MSGPYRCFMCGGCGMVEVGGFLEGDIERCPECKGTGERWPESNSPSLEQIGAMMEAGVPVSHMPATKNEAAELLEEIAVAVGP